jgi:LPXTG-motif cell wall-anchored protein
VTTVVQSPVVTTQVVVTSVVAPVVIVPVVVTPAAVPVTPASVVVTQQADGEGTKGTAGGTLAYTGTNALRDLAVAGLLIVIGSLMVVGTRRRRAPR